MPEPGMKTLLSLIPLAIIAGLALLACAAASLKPWLAWGGSALILAGISLAYFLRI